MDHQMPCFVFQFPDGYPDFLTANTRESFKDL
jgi:hypothetical protein